jgi:hypothetical protein
MSQAGAAGVKGGRSAVASSAAGPAGMCLGFCKAQSIVLDKPGDFLRDFCGDTVHPRRLNPPGPASPRMGAIPLCANARECGSRNSARYGCLMEATFPARASSVWASRPEHAHTADGCNAQRHSRPSGLPHPSEPFLGLRKSITGFVWCLPMASGAQLSARKHRLLSLRVFFQSRWRSQTCG